MTLYKVLQKTPSMYGFVVINLWVFGDNGSSILGQESFKKENVASPPLTVISPSWILKDSKEINVKFTAEVYCLSEIQVTRAGITQLHENSEEAVCGFFFRCIYICVSIFLLGFVGKITK